MKKKKLNFGVVIFVVMFIACGWFAAEAMGSLTKNVEEGQKVPAYIVGIYAMLMFLLSCILIPVIHEAGHLVMGLLTGYEFVSFRVGSFTLVNENGKLVRKKFNVAGTGGQCLMTHKEVEHPEDIPFFWYHFGGVFFNFITVFICFTVAIIINNPFVKAGLYILAIASLAIGLLNIVPTDAGGVQNDGYNIRSLKKSPIARIVLYKTLLINAKQYMGTRLENISDKLINFSEEEKSSEFGCVPRIFEANVLMNRLHFEEAEKAYDELSKDDKVMGVYRNECKCEKLFCMIMNGKSKDEIDKIYDKQLKQYINLTGKTYVMRKRLMYAYYKMVEQNDSKAMKEYEAAKKMADTYPAKGEYDSEMELLEYVVGK